MHAGLNNLKKTVFYEILNMAGRVFIALRYSDNVLIGNRGFTNDEKENGIVLVFNQRMSFAWDDSGISVTLVFGTSPEKCFIPAEDIMVVYSPELRVQFVVSPQTPDTGNKAKDIEKTSSPDAGDAPEDSKVVRVDFKKKKGRTSKGIK